jgi:hypothetical protein
MVAVARAALSKIARTLVRRALDLGKVRDALGNATCHRRRWTGSPFKAMICSGVEREQEVAQELNLESE